MCTGREFEGAADAHSRHLRMAMNTHTQLHRTHRSCAPWQPSDTRLYKDTLQQQQTAHDNTGACANCRLMAPLLPSREQPRDHQRCYVTRCAPALTPSPPHGVARSAPGAACLPTQALHAHTEHSTRSALELQIGVCRCRQHVPAVALVVREAARQEGAPLRGHSWLGRELHLCARSWCCCCCCC